MAELAARCSERDKLLSAWTDRSNRLSELEERKLAAINNGDVGFGRFDCKIRKAKETEDQADQAYHRHLNEHGCG